VYLSTSRRSWGALLSLALLAYGSVLPAAGAPPQVTCEACIVVEDGTVVWSRAPQAELPNASTTKMTTALLVARAAEPREVVQVSAGAAAVGGGGHDLSTGDVYTVEDLLLALLLSSSNEAAAALAEHVAGTQEAFVARMDRFARRMGLRHTDFANAHGLDASGHHSSPADLAAIGAALLEVPRLARMVKLPRATISLPGGGSTVVENRNVLLETYPGAVGIKTGQTLGAGNVLVAAARREGRLVIAVAMRSADAAADARVLLDRAFARAAPEPPEPAPTPEPESVTVPAGSPVGALVFDPAGAVAIVPAESLAVAGSEMPVLRFEPAAQLTLPLAPGDTVGTLSATGTDGLTVTTPALAQGSVPVEDRSWASSALAGMLGAFARLAEGFTA
jgi:D-alanyl-D-alanine carboxypeptidase (penicillin-binding protein 5/6)